MNISYTVSPYLRSEIEILDEIRNKVLLQLLPPSLERKRAWEAKINRTYFTILQEDKKLRKARIEQIFRETTQKKNLPKVEIEAHRYKVALDYIEQNWTLEPDFVTEKEVKKLYEILTRTQPQKIKEVKATLDFIQSTPEHPVIQAALAYQLLLPHAQDTEIGAKIAMLTAYIFLYKGGHDLKKQLVLEEFFARDIENIKEATRAAYKTGNFSPFLNNFINATRTQAEALLTTRQEIDAKDTQVKAFFKLNDRQKQILTVLEEPGAHISNKKVQQRYDISQVTASRDLAKLTDLGLIRSHGKGRSVYYTISKD